jgi:hypothetical protein
MEQRALVGFGLFALLVGAGCGGDGPARYRVSGTVSFNGQPVPGGEITFSPDISQGNSGPGSFALIKQGKYETFRDKGAVAGPHRVSISGYNAMPGEIPDDQIKELFPIYQTTIELSTKDQQHNFDIPAAASQ